MYPYIKCSCGNSIGNIYQYFINQLKLKYPKKEDSKLVINFYYNTNNKINIDNLLNDCYIIKECCRMRLITQVFPTDY